MFKVADPLTQWVLAMLLSVVMGTLLLIAVAFLRRWQQVRHAGYVHALRREYRPLLAKMLRGEQRPTGIEALRELPSSEQEILLDPLLSRRKLSARQLVFLQALCVELGLVALWEGHVRNCPAAPAQGMPGEMGGHSGGVVHYVQRVRSIGHLGKLRHRPSWPLLLDAVNDHRPEVHLAALRSLVEMGAAESFPALCERLHAAIRGQCRAAGASGLLSTLERFDIHCAAALAPSLHDPDPRIRMHAVEIVRAMLARAATRQSPSGRWADLLTSAVTEAFLTRLAIDPSAEVRGRIAEVIVFFADARVPTVLGSLLRDAQWFVRLRSVRAASRLRQAAAPLQAAISLCLQDPHWRVREAAIQTLLALGPGAQQRLYAHLLSCHDGGLRQQIVEGIERSGLMFALVQDYCEGKPGSGARIVESLANGAAPLGITAILHSLPPEIRNRFLDRLLSHPGIRSRLIGSAGKFPMPGRSPLLFPPSAAA